MQNYLTRKKTLMGKRYEVEVPLAQYGGAIVRSMRSLILSWLA